MLTPCYGGGEISCDTNSEILITIRLKAIFSRSNWLANLFDHGGLSFYADDLPIN